MSSAPPLPPDIIAPACPILLPGGAVNPAIKPTVGFFNFDFLRNSAEKEVNDTFIQRLNAIKKDNLTSREKVTHGMYY